MLLALLLAVLAFTKNDAAQSTAAAAAAPAGVADSTAPAVVPSAAGGATAASSSSSSSSNPVQPKDPSSADQRKWAYLLRLQQASPRWAAALAAFDAKWPGWRDDAQTAVALSASVPVSGEAMQQLQQQYTDTLELCRALAAAAPLPLVCSNPSCESLARVSEAAAASKRCTGCRCRYCSAACQTADWKRHKHASACLLLERLAHEAAMTSLALAMGSS
jgi:hypothetical protein